MNISTHPSEMFIGHRLLPLTAVVLIAMFAAGILNTTVLADPTKPPGQKVEGVFGEGMNRFGEPDSKTGAMTWNYSFRLLAARGRPQPELSLSYNSSSLDREAGYGWGLNLPVIEIKPLSGNPCFEQDGTPIACQSQHLAGPHITEERFTFSGQPLVIICTVSGSPAADNSSCGREKQPDWTSGGGWRYFRLQVEGQFLRFYLSGDRRYWRVQRKGGDLLEFGDLPDTKRPGTESAFGNKNAILRWHLVRYSDGVHKAFGAPINYVDYRWRQIGKRGLLYLTDIFDTPRANGAHGDTDFAHHTHLDWENPDFPQTYYADPFRATSDLRLTRVWVASMPWSGIGPREVIRTYNLHYAAAQGAISRVPLSEVFYLWHHSFLSEIRMEGRCRQLEDVEGNVAPNHECPGTHLPPTTFEYEDGYPVFGGASITKVQGGPPNAVDENRVLPYLKSVGLVDFNRDGMPDIVQSWDAEFCPGAGKHEAAINDSIVIGPNNMTGVDKDSILCNFKTDDGDESRIIASSRPIIGYLNNGINIANLKLDYQCMDAGRIDDTTGLAHFNAEHKPAFFTDTGGVTLVGSWGEGIVAWDVAQYSPFRAKPLMPGPTAGEYQPGSGCDAEHFKEVDFHPGWRWEKTQSAVEWAKTAESSPPNHTPRWFTDVDGDGLVDQLADSGARAFDFNVAFVEFTRRYAKNESTPTQGSGPAQVPFSPDFGTAESLAPSTESRADTRFFYVDVNGDGLVDLVTQNPNDSGGVPRVRPGDGRGHFLCENSQQPWPCQEGPTDASPTYEITATGSLMPWPFNDETFFHDVTGDGLADIVQYDMQSGQVRLWVNQDGHSFACVTASCVAGKVVDDRTGTFDIGDHRVTFADMNADGIDDIVILTKQGAYVGMFMEKYLAVQGFEGGTAPKPGLLTRVHNGYGATTDIRYQTIQQLDLAARNTAFAWQYHSPVVESVVTQVITQDSYHAGGDLSDPQLSAPYQFKRKAQYYYQNPAYDRWSRSFVGFRKVVTRNGDEQATTTTTYWFGPCQNNSLDTRLPATPDVPLCPEGSDDDEHKALTGRAVRVDRGTDFLDAFPIDHIGGPRLLWSKTFQYSSELLFDRADRHVTFAYPSQIDTYYYDDARPTVAAGLHIPVAGGDSLEDVPHQRGIRKHSVHKIEYDSHGTVKKVTEEGVIRDEDSKPTDVADATTITLFSPRNPFDADGPSGPDDAPAALPCTSNWQCSPEYISIWVPQPTLNGGLPPKLLRKSHLTYTSDGDIQSLEGWLDEPSEPLQRHHPAGNRAIAKPPAAQSLGRGWHTFATLNYDALGNVIHAVGSQSTGGAPASCTEIAYDGPYQHLPNLTRNFTDGCGGLALETRSLFDRGFEQVAIWIAPNGGENDIHYDQFGRPIEFYLPNPDAAAGTQKPVLAATIGYSDHKPLSYVDVQRIVGPGTSTRSVTVLNSLGETAVTFDKGDNNDWVLDNWKESDLTGQVAKVRKSWAFSSDPITTAEKANAIPVPVDNSFFEVSYDGFGRRISIREARSTGFSQEVMRNSYFPLAFETRDAEQLKAGGPHEKAFKRVEFDGRGRSTRVAEHIANPRDENIVTTVEYQPTGEPVTITRTHAGSSYQRTMKFDSLGRLMVNREPNTGNNWRYVWDDAGRIVGTSDARGCGENLDYDGLGRVIGEDYSPCLASQPPYTPPNLVTGEGLEVVYHYDTYEADQFRPEPGFVEDPKFAIGNLVAVSDRGSHTRFNYDGRGRIRRLSRQIAKPEGVSLSSPYAPHWFISRLDYDLGDRLTRKTTGVDVKELIMNGGSEERYAYSPRGLVSGIDSSYGTVVKSMTYDSDGEPKHIVYGDARGTTASFSYDLRHRLTQYLLVAPYNGVTSPVEHFDIHYSYDDVGNPLNIGDQRLPWTPLPPEASPVTMSTMQYDDLYRLTRLDSTYDVPGGIGPWQSPYAGEIATGDRHPVPLRSVASRIKQQAFDFDGVGNLTESSDDLSARYDRSLGPGLGYGTSQNGPNQLRSGQGLEVRYDEAGNVTDLKLQRPGNCPTATLSQCAQWFVYDWDEIGQLARARRWDFDGNTLPPEASPNVKPSKKPSWDLSYAYSQGSQVRKSLSGADQVAQHTLEVFDTLRVEHAQFNSTNQSYGVQRDTVHVYPGGIAHVFWDTDKQLPHQAPDSLITMDLIVGDHLGSSSVVINHSTGELVERTTYQPYGAVESDYRPAKWQAFREPYKFTGKEEDIEVGASYFGARYFQPYLGRFLSADPLTIHALGSDLNPYAYVGGRVMSAVDHNGLDPCGGDGTIDCVEVKGPPRGSAERNAELANARADASAENARIRQPMPSTTKQPEKTPAPPDWTTQVEWTFSRPDSRLLQPITSTETGNRPLNFVLNKVLLPWRNVLAYYENIPLAILVGTDNALEQSNLQPEYHAAQVMLPMARTMGILGETAPAMQFLAGISEQQRLAAAEENLWTLVSKGPDGVDLVEIEHMAKSAEGRRSLEEILAVIPEMTPRNGAEFRYLLGMKFAIQHTLRQ